MRVRFDFTRSIKTISSGTRVASPGLYFSTALLAVPYPYPPARHPAPFATDGLASSHPVLNDSLSLFLSFSLFLPLTLYLGNNSTAPHVCFRGNSALQRANRGKDLLSPYVPTVLPTVWTSSLTPPRSPLFSHPSSLTPPLPALRSPRALVPTVGNTVGT